MAKNTIEICEDSISYLKQEIGDLTDQYKENQREIAFLSSNNIKKALMAHQRKHNNDDGVKVMKNIQTKLLHSENEINLFKEITGIEFTKYLKKTEHKTGKEVLYNHKLVGLCQSFSFNMEFKTLEYQGEGRTSCDVTHISIHMDCKAQSDLMKLVSMAEKSMNLLGFFRTLSAFAEWYEYRKSTFIQFKEKYPFVVGLPLGSSGDYMVLINPDLPSCEMMLVWKVTINEEGTVTPILDLLPKLPEQAEALDKTGVLEDAGLGFKALLQVFGIKGSIENIIQAFCLKEASA